MKITIPRIMVMFMTTAALAQPVDWSNFNSSLVIEVTRPEGKFTCSGVAIKDDMVLTAAHCLEGKILQVRVFNQDTYNPEAKSWNVEHFQLHPEYNKSNSNFKSDLARIKLSSKLPASTTIYPILKNENNFKGKLLRVGYGARSQSNIRTLITPQFKSLKTEDKVLELDDMYSYSGDSGGPIFIQRDGQMYLVAIHSTLSYGPQGKFSYNPLVSSQRDWIFANWN
ncbi:MAG: trypsin-like serine protease [Bdellovibrionales bacterium]|nr:trypsin-like serine protease [Bdellovibrionales bacterium]